MLTVPDSETSPQSSQPQRANPSPISPGILGVGSRRDRAGRIVVVRASRARIVVVRAFRARIVVVRAFRARIVVVRAFRARIVVVRAFWARSVAYWLAVLLLLSLGACVSTSKGTIGAVLAQSADGRVTLREVPPDLAAGKAGLQPGDEILLVDGLDVRQLDPQTIHDLLSGEVGTPIDLTLLRGEEVLQISLVRSAARRHRTTQADHAE